MAVSFFGKTITGGPEQPKIRTLKILNNSILDFGSKIGPAKATFFTFRNNFAFRLQHHLFHSLTE